VPASVHLDQGSGPVVVLLHGVGAGPEAFDRLVAELGDDHRCVVVARPGGGGGAVPLIDQADAVAAAVETVDAAGGLLVGVSGGATLGLLVAQRHPNLFARHLLHEPLVGPLAPALHARFVDAADRAARSLNDAMGVVRAVMGPDAWEALGPDGQQRSTIEAARWQAEVAAFAAFAPTADDLAAIAPLAVTVSIGERSGPERREAAEVLVHHAAVELATVPGSGNAPHLDGPHALAALVRSVLASPLAAASAAGPAPDLRPAPCSPVGGPS
jgi:pimeloyl-ACP methyl ester carboxylesterase